MILPVNWMWVNTMPVNIKLPTWQHYTSVTLKIGSPTCPSSYPQFSSRLSKVQNYKNRGHSNTDHAVTPLQEQVWDSFHSSVSSLSLSISNLGPVVVNQVALFMYENFVDNWNCFCFFCVRLFLKISFCWIEFRIWFLILILPANLFDSNGRSAYFRLLCKV